MVSLIDIAPRSQKISINGSALEVSGIGARGIASLLLRFPALQQLMIGRIDAELLWRTAPEAISAIIAAGLGKLEDAETETQADQLPIGVQMELLFPIIQLTMPQGVGPFVERWGAMIGGPAQSVASIQGNSSQKPSNS